jgi:hypothetical protein
MQVSVTINLGTDDIFNTEPIEVAQKILEAVGGDPNKDVCYTSIMAAPVTGQAGATLDLAPVQLPAEPENGEPA